MKQNFQKMLTPSEKLVQLVENAITLSHKRKSFRK